MPTSTVNKIHILTQAVKNTKTTLEIIRESISNSTDAEAREINIELSWINGDEWDIIIDDNGFGMLSTHLSAFFSAGVSLKNYNLGGGAGVSIGEKGLGSKTCFKARNIKIETIFHANSEMLVAEMADPMAQLQAGNLPTYTENAYTPTAYPANATKTTQGVRMELSRVVIKSWNGVKCRQQGGGYDLQKIHDRLMHYLRSSCATGTTRLRHSGKTHVARNIAGAARPAPLVTLTIIEGANQVTSTETGSYNLPGNNNVPVNGDPHLTHPHILENSKKFCMIIDGGNTTNINRKPVNYDWTAIIAGEDAQNFMIGNEKSPGVGAKSLMGIHFCKDFIPLPDVDTKYSKHALDPEYFYQYKVFLNSQSFELNADRSMITNLESDEVEWIKEDFVRTAKPQLTTIHDAMAAMLRKETADIKAADRLADAQNNLANYGHLSNLVATNAGANLNYVKIPSKEVDVSHIIAAMFQDGNYVTDFDPLTRFGKFIDGATDAIFEDARGTAKLVEIEFSLRNLFNHGHPITSFDSVMVWTLGGLLLNHVQSLPWGAGGGNVNVTLTKDARGRWILTWAGYSKRLYVIEEFI
jgi:hypothetical protein